MSSGKKRPNEAPAAGGEAKRPKTSWQQPVTGNLSPITLATPAAAPPSSGAPAGGLDMAAIRAQIAARMASLKPSSAASPPPATSSKPPSFLPSSLPPQTTPNVPPEIAARLAAMKAKIAEQQARLSNPYLSGSGSLPVKEEGERKKGGLGSVAAHPLLADIGRAGSQEDKKPVIGGPAKKERYQKTMAPKFTSVLANSRTAPASSSSSLPSTSHLIAPSINPYSTAPALPDSGSAEPVSYGQRKAKPMLKFIQPGKFIQKAEEQRNERKMDELRARIAEQSRKAGMGGEWDVLERNIKRQPPPEVEWWDLPLLSTKSYDDLDSPDPKALLITTDDSLVTAYVQHPIPIPPPGLGGVEVRGLMLTKKEQKKMRRQRRAAELRDKQDRQKMGLIPPDPPKVRLANIMKVLTTSSVQDPTKVEARVRREVAARLEKHERENSDRQLTDEQRREKKEEKKMKEEGKGLGGMAFKIKYLVNNAHKFKIKQNADQLALAGLCMFHPEFAVVYVEGSAKSLKTYKRLMTVRIDWTEEARPKAEEEVEGMEVDPDAEPEEEVVDTRKKKLESMQETPESLADNRCEVVWEGELGEKGFKRFRLKNVETDREAKDALGKGKEGIWDLCKRWIWEGVDE